ncbi:MULTISPECIES: hypothetical protein [Lysinibacillus]|uniref:Uncharacterized protein n=1 Tax=Lysinibacillus fusiformis TaxID=28031 RepID=A0A1H9F4X7_9BACI|nr:MULTISPECIES: hypothetical protein [Lysinibacillus]MCG7436225.1 hypothetical protein [Lysinibacillus fusiformis]MED4669275.1 hypothetical protein [Lysinibacillus fusiformis]QAS57772.1 hypothetical protein LSP_16260 [Lysinibacillus sphaericus]RDV34322.1 hypothetical protein C7B90_06105 [Lysinibacillus fusiformis]SCX50744.1 hypothetical protein SAMN02787108_01683 [Lysinibacillus fusiformis]
MEESKLYTTQEIENLRQKIETYRESLSSLKMGSSIEDFLYMKQEFDGLKTQMAHLEGITETLDTKQNSYIKGYDDQIRLLSIQIESLNQTMEEMNQEILAVLNKLVTVEGNDTTTISPSNKMPSQTSATHIPRQPRMIQTADKTTITSAQPSYRLLQNLAGKATNHQQNVNNNGASSPHNDRQTTKPEERHFNQQYFQSINTHPSHIYNGLFRNTTVESTFHFKNATDAKEVPVSVYDPSAVQLTLSEEDIEKDHLPSTIVHESSTGTEKTDDPIEVVHSKNERNNHEISEVSTESLEQVHSGMLSEPVSQDNSAIANEPLNQVVSESVTEPADTHHSPSLETEEYVEVYNSEEVYEVHSSLEKENKQPDPVNTPIEENKKGKNSFFDFFKRWS